MRRCQRLAKSRVLHYGQIKPRTNFTLTWAQCVVSSAALTCNGGLPLIEP